ncbi:MAG: type II secretion system protein [Planctomycetes bacterium]|nr:type II secretion system protein [Planctomycetota bacterium]
MQRKIEAHRQVVELAWRSARRAGFTLIELLAVIVILGILSYFLFTNLTGVLGQVDVSVSKVTAQHISLALGELTDDTGDFAPSALPVELGTPPNMENLGAEALYVALCADGKPGFGKFDDHLGNTDDDALGRKAPGFEVATLFEICDQWGNPFAYFHWRDYGREDKYATLQPDSGERLVSGARAQKNPETGNYFEPRGFQLISAGADGEFGTDDDIFNFKRAK